MSVITFTPTPPTVKHGVFVDCNFNLTGVDYFDIHASEIKGIPQIWRIHSAKITVGTDATVANRIIIVTHYAQMYGYGYIPGGNTIEVLGSNLIPASTGWSLFINSRKYHYGTPYVSEGDHIGEDKLIFQGKDYLRFSVGSGKAGDTFRGVIRLEYMNRHYNLPTPYDDEGQGG